MPPPTAEPGPRQAGGVDVGGTFTDVVVVAEDGGVLACKVPTTPDDQGEGVAQGLAAASSGPVPRVAHGTTTATNAVLERRVGRTALVVTEGFGDVLTIARQNRPALYDLGVVRPEHLVPQDLVVGVSERMGPDGRPVIALTQQAIDRAVAAVAALRPEAVAISLLFSFAGAAHEEALAAALEARLGRDVPVTVSSRLVGEFREYERTSTCVLNAAVAPVMGRYLSRLADRLSRSVVSVMTSGGGTIGLQAAAEVPVQTLLSGPAAGVVAAAATARSAGFQDAVAFDMGGTSTDVCLIMGGEAQLSSTAEIGGLPFLTSAVAVHTVGAGGGSLAWLDAGGALRVGPGSAGARPGPACYGLGGIQPTVTDAHCSLGHLDPGGSLGGGAVRLDADAAERALARLPENVSGEEGAAAGIVAVARATMARALRRVTTEQGVDPAQLVLVAYGGAGPLHATALARELGMAAVIVPPAPGVLSALGLLLAPPRVECARTVMQRLAPGEQLSSDDVWSALEATARADLAEQGEQQPALERVADCRYAGQSHELRVCIDRGGVRRFRTPTAWEARQRRPQDERGGVRRFRTPTAWEARQRRPQDERGGVRRFRTPTAWEARQRRPQDEGSADLAAGLHAAHQATYGYANPDEDVEVVTLRVVATGTPRIDAPPAVWDLPGSGPLPERERLLGHGRHSFTARVLDRSSLAVGASMEGPAVIEQPDATTLLAPGEAATVDEHGNLLVRCDG